MTREEIRLLRAAKGIVRLYESLCEIELEQKVSEKTGEVTVSAKDWVYQPVRALDRGRKVGEVVKVRFLPVRVDWAMNELIWRHLDRVLIMSGSWCDKATAIDSIGLERSGIDFRYIEADQEWDKGRMPIYRMTGANVTKDKKGRSWCEQECWRNLTTNAMFAIGKQKGEKMIVHSVSFELGEALGKELGEVFGLAEGEDGGEPGGRILIHQQLVKSFDEDGFEVEAKSSLEKARLIQKLREGDGGLVLISPSIEMGVDLPNGDCRGVVYAKCPWGDLGNKQISKRKDQGREGWIWYMNQAAMKFVQGIFRGCRWRGDWCRVWLLDEQFDRLIDTSLLYKWIKARLRPKGDLGCRPIPTYVKR